MEDSWKDLYFAMKELKVVYKKWCDELKEENRDLRNRLNTAVQLTTNCSQECSNKKPL